ncbi:hypothetical protein [Stenotrophomonas sp. PS02300]|uniref:hypothetical protein n=1 Tax=Stenotrophomonas sp. PS02300 TaxID=2991426 RepID=UPI00249B5205|nr:hypothetical protein [Stenotrophomonas sp. PS02300]
MFDRFSQLAAGDFQIVVRLQIQPQPRAFAEVASKLQGRVGSDTAGRQQFTLITGVQPTNI